MTVAVITIVSGRHDHLARQHRGLTESVVLPEHYVVVAMNDPELVDWMPDLAPVPTVVSIQSSDRLPLAAARNRGATTAIEAGADVLVFLDVDCIPSAELVERYVAGLAERPDAVLTGAVGYLPEGTLEPADAAFHGFRPRPAAGEIEPGDAELFWSLSFATTSDLWTQLGGFDEGYAGYGAEDTDFALRAREAGVEIGWVGGAEALHQYHPTQSPPVQHLDDILVNGARFAERWGFWPMRGWLDAFAERGLVKRNPTEGFVRA